MDSSTQHTRSASRSANPLSTKGVVSAEGAPTANATEVRYQGSLSGAPYSRDEDHAESPFATVVSVLLPLYPTNFGAIQHASGSICYDPAIANLRLSRKDCPTPSLEGDHMKSVPYPGSWLIDVRYGRETARHSACGWSR
jgi:hypothetical protein